MFELSLYRPPSHSLSLSNSFKALFSLRAFLAWPFYVGGYQSSFYDCINFGLQKELSLSLPLSLSLSLALHEKRQKASPADHLIISCSALFHLKCTCQ